MATENQVDKLNKICSNCKNVFIELNNELESIKTRCKNAEDERDKTIEELKCLEREMDEMHDTFKEDESEQFEQIKQELDSTMKSNKILQIRLNKCERLISQLEQSKIILERQLENSNKLDSVTNLNTNFSQINSDFVKLSCKEYDQLLKDLNDIGEREKDLQEQMKFFQEEAQLKSERLSSIETENEILLGKINRLTLINSRFRANSFKNNTNSNEKDSDKNNDTIETKNLIEQNEQLNLALELAQSECQRLKTKLKDTTTLLETKDTQLNEYKSKYDKLETEFNRISSSAVTNKLNNTNQNKQTNEFEVECRKLRSRLVLSERDCKQLRAQLELLTQARQSNQSKLKAFNEQTNQIRLLEEQLNSFKKENSDLELKLKRLLNLNDVTNSNNKQTSMESDLINRLKSQLSTNENELAKAKSRLVELDLDCGKAQRQYKRLLNNLEESSETFEKEFKTKRIKLPQESQRDLMSRVELRQLVKELENEMEQLINIIKAKDCLIKELPSSNDIDGKSSSISDIKKDNLIKDKENIEEQLKSLKRLLEQERLLSCNLKIDVTELEKLNTQLLNENQMFERQQKSIDEELDKLRQLNLELNFDLEEAKKNFKLLNTKFKDVQGNYEKACLELRSIKSNELNDTNKKVNPNNSKESDILILERDLSELKVKNGFLMRQLELNQEETNKLIEEQKNTFELQQKRSIELNKLELKEIHLNEIQSIKDELNEIKDKNVSYLRQIKQLNEELENERSKFKSLDRELKREKSQLQQKLQQFESQASIEKRSNEYKIKEIESICKEKDRKLLNFQEQFVQLERDFKRLQNKYKFLEENNEIKEKNLIHELEMKRKENDKIIIEKQTNEKEFYKKFNQFNSERSTLIESLESIKKSYNEKLNELKSLKELLILKQEQNFKERCQFEEKIDSLTNDIIKCGENEMKLKLEQQQMKNLERQFEEIKKDYLFVKDERIKLKSRCSELEKRCNDYEKQELISKTATISTNSIFKFNKSSYQTNESNKKKQQDETKSKQQTSSIATSSEQQQTNKPTTSNELIDKLSGKINDQRHLINMLKQQNYETQMELKQLKLIQSFERNKWKIQLALITSRLNECNEKLEFETNLLITNNDNINSKIIERCEIRWNEERSTLSELIQQQQNQLDSLTKDMKKLNQSHELLRLQNKQLESSNNKLSRRLIDYEQNERHAPLPSLQEESRKPGRLELELRAARSEWRQEELRREQLERLNAELVGLLKAQAQPLVEIVAKILNSLEETKKCNDNQANQSDTGQNLTAFNSTSRPLRIKTDETKLDHSTSLESDSNITFIQSELAQRSRLSRLLNKPAKKETAPLPVRDTSGTKSVRRARVRCASLGITASEKRQLRGHLQELEALLGRLSARSARPSRPLGARSQPVQPHLSLTDYESESSLASELSLDLARLPAPKKRTGLKSRLGSTLRSLSRGFGGLSAASDSEVEQSWPTAKKAHSPLKEISV